MKEKQRCMILFFSIFWAFLISSAGLLLASKKSKNIYCGKNTAIIRWPPHGVTALQIVRASFLGPRPRLSPNLGTSTVWTIFRLHHNYGRYRPHIYRCLNTRQQQVDEHYINRPLQIRSVPNPHFIVRLFHFQIPVHDCPFPRNPGLQLQLKEP